MSTTNGELTLAIAGLLCHRVPEGNSERIAETIIGPHQYDNGRLLVAAWNTIHRIASRLGVDPLRLAESGAVEHMAALYADIHAGNIGISATLDVTVALAACRQEDGK